MEPRSAAAGERGQTVVLFALALLALVAVGSVVVDGGYTFVQFRRAQNAADLASLAATSALQPVCAGQGTVSDGQVSAVVADLVAANAPAAAGRWTGTYLGQNGQPLTDTPTLPGAGGEAPSGACGVRLAVHPQWPPLLAQVLGVTGLGARASAAAVVGDNPAAAPVGHSAGIVALAPSGGHTIWGGGSGQFQINGNIMDDSTGGCSTPGCYADTVDNFGSSGTSISGQMDSVAPIPLDPCFDPAGATSAVCPQHTSGEITYAGGMFGGLPYEPDPLTYVPAPTAADTACPGGTVQTFTANPAGAFTPGVYAYPVYITGSATFSDCGGSPGIYLFEDGLSVCPGSGQAVSGSDIVLYNEAAPSGGGGGGPGGPGGPGGTTSPCGSQATGAGPGAGPDGIYLGGQGSVTLSGADSGLFAHMLLYQDRGVAANIGLDNHTADGATISLTGAVYDNSESSGSGGTLVSGGGSGGGDIAANGIVVVDRFATAGTASVVITYNPAEVPGVGAVLVQ